MATDKDAAFELFVIQHGSDLLRLAVLLTQDRSHAQDVVQTALIKTYQRWHTIRDADKTLAFTRRVVATTAASRRRRRSHQEIVELPQQEQAVGDAGDALAERDRLNRALRELPARMRAVLVLRYWADMSETDTAQFLGISRHTVRSQTVRGLARVRTHLDRSDSCHTGVHS